MKKLVRLGFTREEIEDLKIGYIIRKDNDFCKMDYRLYKRIYDIRKNDYEIVLQESHSGYGVCDFWTEWEDVTSNIQF